MLKVSRSGFYDWNSRPESAQSIANRELTAKIIAVHEESHGIYGSPRIHAVLWASERCGKNRAVKLMCEAGIRGKFKAGFRPQTTDSKHDLPIAPNLVRRKFAAPGPNQIWLADITYVPTKEGWVYLASILDVFSRTIVGWSMRDNMRKELVISALTMAISKRQPGAYLIHHSDRGSQYAPKAHRTALDKHGIACS